MPAALRVWSRARPGHRSGRSAPYSPCNETISPPVNVCQSTHRVGNPPVQAQACTVEADDRSTVKDHRDRLFLIGLLAHTPAAIVIGLLMSGESWLHVTSESVAPGTVP